MISVYLKVGIVMKSKKVIVGMAAILFCLVFVGALSAREHDREFSDFAVERSLALSSNQFHLDANRGGIGIKTTEDSLEDLENAYYYQMIEDQSVNINDGKMEVSAPLKDQLKRNNNHPSCKC